MAKSTGLAVFALIIAIGALGLGTYQVFFVSAPTGEESGIRNTWSDFQEAGVVTNPTSQYILVDQLIINFTVNPGESALFLFSTSASIQSSSSIEFYFTLDGVVLSETPYPYWQFSSPVGLIQTPVSFHYMLESISVGSHGLSIHLIGSHVSNQIQYSSLLVQTIIL